MGHRAGVHARRHQTSDVGHIRQQIGTHLIGDGTEGLEINGAGIGGIAAHDQLGLVLQGQLADGVEVELLGVGVHAVVHGLEPLAAHVHRRAMGEVAAVAEVHAQDRVARLQQRQEHREIGLGAAVGLHVGPGGTKQLLGPLNRQFLDGVHVLAAAVVALGRQTLGVLVGEHRALGLHHGPGGEVLGGDQLQVRFLAIQLLVDQGRNGGITAGQRGVDRCTAGSRHETRARWVDRKKPTTATTWPASTKKPPRRAALVSGAPGEIRTPDPLIRSQML